MLRRLLLAFAILNACVALSEPADSVARSPRRGLINRLTDYMTEDSVELEENSRKRFHFSILGGPSYSSDTKFSIGLAGVMNYRLKGCEYPMPPSTLTVTASVSTAKFWSVGASGPTLIAGDSRRVNTDVWIGYLPLDFWGMGYDMAADNANKGNMQEFKAKIRFDYLWRLAPSLYMGPSIEWNYHNSGKMDRPELLEGQDGVVRNYGVGLTLQYDSRDVMNNAYRGMYIYGNVLFRPRFMWNTYAFTTLDLRACYYHSAWTGAIIAGELRGLFNFGNPSWAMMSRLGNTNTMRGYYQGRFRDKHMTTVQVELRQHVWQRFGVVAWGGCGSVFRDSDSFKHWLPNYGLGCRWEFRNRTNVRLDYGFGSKGENGFMFSINEAF